MSDSLATWLNDEVAKRGWSLRQTASKAHLSHTTVVKIANAERTPTPRTCRALAQALNVDANVIYRLSGILLAQPAPDHRSPLRPEDVEDRLVVAWRGLSEDDQARVLDLAERLAGRVQPRIIGDPAES